MAEENVRKDVGFVFYSCYALFEHLYTRVFLDWE